MVTSSSPLYLLARSQSWPEALHWYNTALETTDCDEGGEYDGMQDEPRYMLLAREAEMLFTGGCGLEKDPQRSGSAWQTCPWGGTGLDSERDMIPLSLGITTRCKTESLLSILAGRKIHTGPVLCKAGYPYDA